MIPQQSLPTSMPALVWTAPGSMVMQETPVPQPAAGELLLEVAAVGICGSELSGYLGQSSLRVPPLVMGHEFSARVAACAGPQAHVLADGSWAQAGQLVAVNPLVSCGVCDLCVHGLPHLCPQRWVIGAHRAGAFARFVTAPAAQCWPLPEKTSDVAGALVEPLACAVRAVGHASGHAPGLSGGRRSGPLLILGAGAIGLFCLAVARAGDGAPVVISDVMGERLQVAAAWGAALTVNGRAADAEQQLAAALPHGAAAVIDAVGSSMTRALALKFVQPGGRVVFIGLHEEASPLAANYVVRQEINIQGSYSYTPADFGRAIELLADGVIQPSAIWVAERPLHTGPEAFAGLVAGAITTPKIILRP